MYLAMTLLPLVIDAAAGVAVAAVYQHLLAVANLPLSALYGLVVLLLLQVT